jgi:transposase
MVSSNTTLSYHDTFELGVRNWKGKKLEGLAHRRHDISDKLWYLLSEHLPGGKGKVGRRAADNRTFINAVLWILRTGAPWRDLPPDYGDWKNTHRRFSRWRDKSVWENLLHLVMDEPDFEWLMIDASHCKVHPHATGAKGGNQDMSRTKGAQHKGTLGRGCAWCSGLPKQDTFI